MEYITGEKLRQRWNIEKFELMSKITTDGQRDFNPSLTPISAAFFKPYECVIRVYVGESMRREMPEYQIKAPGDIFNKLDDVLFCLADVEAWESTHDTGKTPATTPKTQTPEEYIKQAKKNKIKKELIALELRDKFSLTYLQIGRKLRLDAGLQESQIDALKQRAKRLCEAGEKLKS